jgi:hypothetical protein
MIGYQLMNKLLKLDQICFVKSSKDIALKHAMRYAILDQILKFKNNCDELICANCGSVDYILIDHVILFKTLHDDFLQQNTLPVPSTFDNTYFNSAEFKDVGKDF